jgi:sulfopyruvate decarboxylase TPP-binding subunit
MNLEAQTGRNSKEVAAAIADVLAGAGAELVASLPDGWIATLIKHLDSDKRFRHLPVNREESAVGL